MLAYPALLAIHRSRYRRTFILASSILGAVMGFFWMLQRLGLLA
jgi:hypothetical protein